MPALSSRRRSATPTRPSNARRVKIAALVPLLAALAGCGYSSEDKFAPACPRTSILASAADLTRYRADPAAQAGQDVTDMVLGGRITGVSGTCQRAEETILGVTATVGFDLTRGPASRSRTEDVPFFVAVVQDGQILDKRVFRIRADFPANTDRQRLTSDEVHLMLPITRAKSGASYDLLVGFQLTPEELAANRRRGER